MHPDIKNLLKPSDADLKRGWSMFDGHMVMQNQYAYNAIYDLIQDLLPDTIIEIGTSRSGLTRFLRRSCDILSPQSRIISYDIHKIPRASDSISDRIEYRLENCFVIDRKPENIPNQQKLFNDIKSSKRCIILCDGGSKHHEFNVIATQLSCGDVIMAHDYAHSKEIYKSEILGKFWNWNEITYNDISKAIEENNLSYYKRDVFSKAVWGCFIKN